MHYSYNYKDSSRDDDDDTISDYNSNDSDNYNEDDDGDDDGDDGDGDGETITLNKGHISMDTEKVNDVTNVQDEIVDHRHIDEIEQEQVNVSIPYHSRRDYESKMKTVLKKIVKLNSTSHEFYCMSLICIPPRNFTISNLTDIETDDATDTTGFGSNSVYNSVFMYTSDDDVFTHYIETLNTKQHVVWVGREEIDEKLFKSIKSQQSLNTLVLNEMRSCIGFTRNKSVEINKRENIMCINNIISTSTVHMLDVINEKLNEKNILLKSQQCGYTKITPSPLSSSSSSSLIEITLYNDDQCDEISDNNITEENIYSQKIVDLEKKKKPSASRQSEADISKKHYTSITNDLKGKIVTIIRKTVNLSCSFKSHDFVFILIPKKIPLKHKKDILPIFCYTTDVDLLSKYDKSMFFGNTKHVVWEDDGTLDSNMNWENSDIYEKMTKSIFVNEK
jgi:hypothetical protein